MAYQHCSYTELEAGEPLTTRGHRLRFLINLQFSGNSLFHYRVIGYDSTEQLLLGSTNQPLSCASILINLQELLCKETARKSIGVELESWPLSLEERHKIIETALRVTREGVTCMPASHNVFYLRFHVNVIFEHVFDFSAIGRVIQRSMDVGEVRMVPAMESSIENLERKKLQAGSIDGACPVCMEEFSWDCEVVCMPCSHYFHGDCITEWLRRSHYCPICRFEMPTS